MAQKMKMPGMFDHAGPDETKASLKIIALYFASCLQRYPYKKLVYLTVINLVLIALNAVKKRLQNEIIISGMGSIVGGLSFSGMYNFSDVPL